MAKDPPPELPQGWSYNPAPPSEPADDRQPTDDHPRQARRRMKRVWLTVAAGFLTVAVVCVLVFVVFHDNIFDGDPGATSGDTTATTAGDQATPSSTMAPDTAAETPEQVVQALFVAMEKKDPDALLALLDPMAVETIFAGESAEDMKDQFFAMILDYGSVEFSNIVLSTQMTSETSATVTVTAGTLTVTRANGAKEVRDVSDAERPVELDVNLREEEWHLNPLSMLSGLF